MNVLLFLLGIQYSLGQGCVSWRQTGACDGNGPREPWLDRGCGFGIPGPWSGFCECQFGNTKYVGCGHEHFTCASICSGVTPQVNQALRRPTLQSTTEWGGDSARGVDGVANSNYGGGSCTHTNHDGNGNWWRVDLQGNVRVSSVRILNRGDCCWDRLARYEVWVGNRADMGRYLDSNGLTRCGQFTGVTAGQWSQVFCNVEGRFVYVSVRGILTLCEVEVYGEREVVRKSCARPDWWCVHGGSGYFEEDCTGNGHKSPVCVDMQGNRGALVPPDCANRWGQPASVPDSVCPRIFGKGCLRPSWWCSGAQVYLKIDCDNDGLLDHTCVDPSGTRWSLTSGNQCKEVINPPIDACPAAFRPKSCSRPSGWCIHDGSFYTEIDCDGDGRPDPVCVDRAGSRGVILPRMDCKHIWPSAAVSDCPAAFGGECIRPSWWCGGSQVYLKVDCDGDGVLDHTCVDPSGTRWTLTSGNKCKEILNPPMNACPAAFRPKSCARPAGFCAGANTFYTELDCDGDGVADPVCVDLLGSKGVVLKERYCEPLWPSATAANCPAFKGCLRPSWWCTYTGANYVSGDCDGDGVDDHVCHDDKGKRFVLASRSGCREVGPRAKPSDCPSILGKLPCLRPSDFCTKEHELYLHVDCDGDGVREHACVVGAAQERGLITALDGCEVSWPNAPFEMCLPAFGCPRAEFCKADGEKYWRVDCDGDGVLDHVCTNRNGERGTILTRKRCARVLASAPVESCPKVFARVVCEKNGGCDPLSECAVDNNGKRVCGPCPSGFTGTGDTKCVDIDECAKDNGGCDPLVRCVNTQGSFTCEQCPSGYVGLPRKCVDVNECLTNNGGCHPKARCINIPGGRNCGECPAGYKGSGIGVDGCVDVNECEAAKPPCDPLTTCTNTDGSFQCSACPPGYEGNGVSGCTDIDECAHLNGGCAFGTRCTNTQGSFTCGSCPAGFTGNGDTGCADIDECADRHGGCYADSKCINTPGSRVCGPCPKGYKGDGITCVDIDECALNNGGCHELSRCENLPGSSQCGPCPAGFEGTGETGCIRKFARGGTPEEMVTREAEEAAQRATDKLKLARERRAKEELEEKEKKDAEATRRALADRVKKLEQGTVEELKRAEQLQQLQQQRHEQERQDAIKAAAAAEVDKIVGKTT